MQGSVLSQVIQSLNDLRFEDPTKLFSDRVSENVNTGYLHHIFFVPKIFSSATLVNPGIQLKKDNKEQQTIKLIGNSPASTKLKPQISLMSENAKTLLTGEYGTEKKQIVAVACFLHCCCRVASGRWFCQIWGSKWQLRGWQVDWGVQNYMHEEPVARQMAGWTFSSASHCLGHLLM